jgi:hypothetical protein
VQITAAVHPFFSKREVFDVRARRERKSSASEAASGMQRGLEGFEVELDLCIKEMPSLSSDPEAKLKKSLVFFSCSDKKMRLKRQG